MQADSRLAERWSANVVGAIAKASATQASEAVMEMTAAAATPRRERETLAICGWVVRGDRSRWLGALDSEVRVTSGCCWS